ncbi:Six-bladed beta-propeller, TolB-like protein [Cynara cardunculus var. scolymus]|uniref:Six-bladed beta-propeller, TolB-like protein n=1 Tax=Cynara cardunculus var. scolymus TaxID=59895 RepID=A0A103NZ15_CYNCS|nr:Six-bladed beta-propeller, TolB-like protein [Cynara cardunculus var. scolymus]
MLNYSVVENWVHTGGRPIGIAIDDFGDVFVADAFKGLLNVSVGGELEFLTDEAEGMKFGLINGIVVAKNGMVYFTKNRLHQWFHDFLEGRPHGRLLSYDPSTKQTNMIFRDHYFANGVELSSNQDFVIFCETFMRKCSRYYLQGEKKGSIDVFVDNLPGVPNNIRYDGDGHYWLDNSFSLKFIQIYPFIRKILAFTIKYLHKMPDFMNYGRGIALDLEGKPIGGYYDNTWIYTTSGVKIGKHLNMGSITRSYILRLNLIQNPLATATS